MLSQALQQAVEGLINGIKGYESDTFSGFWCEVTDEEAQAIAAKLIERLLFAADGCPSSSIDGLLLYEILTEIREEKAAA